MAKDSGDCYIDVWRDVGFGGERLRIYGPAEYPVLRLAQGDWGDDIGSLRVGPNAFVMAYRDRDFKRELTTFGPNDEVEDLRRLRLEDDIDSLKLIDSLKIFERATYNSDLASPPAPVEQAGGGRPRARGKNRKGRRR